MSVSDRTREHCEKHDSWYVPSLGPGDVGAEPCPGCVLEAEAWWRQAEDHNIRVLLDLPGAAIPGGDDA